MQNVQAREQLEGIGLTVGSVHRNLPAAELTARALARQEGILAANGALVVQTGARTGRSPADRFIVDEPAAEGVAWSDVNQPCTPELFEHMLRKASAYLHGREAFVFDGYAGADKAIGSPSGWSPTPRGTRSSPRRSSCSPSRSRWRTSPPGSRSSTAALCTPTRTSTARGRRCSSASRSAAAWC